MRPFIQEEALPKIRVEDAVEKYLEHLWSRKLQPGTVRTMKNSLGLMTRVTGNIWVDKIDNRHIDRVFATYQWQPSTCNTKLQTYRNFFKWCRALKYAPTDWNPMFGWRNVTVPVKNRNRIPRDQWDTLFDHCRHQQERIVLATGLYLFLRASEQQTLQIKHVDLARSEIEIWRTKTQEWDVMPISAELDEYLRQHIIWLATQGAAGPDHFLIPARNRDLEHDENSRWIAGTGTIDPTRPLAKPHRNVQRILQRLGYDTKGEGEHTLRRSGARAYFDELVNQGYDGALRRVQSMLGHKSSVTTELYLGINLERSQRNKSLRGQPMFPTRHTDDNVVKIFREKTP